ncbi:DFDF domain-containing protein [Aphelenchoides besseyi]|nr:DFDF domain-containing protein [Aphelenchoides besseyi]
MAINISTDLKSCVGHLITAEVGSDVYQGKALSVLDDVPAILLTKAFKNGCKMTSEKYALNISPTDVIRVIDNEPIEQSTTAPQSSKPPTTTKAAKKSNETNRRAKAAQQELETKNSKTKTMDELLDKLKKETDLQKMQQKSKVHTNEKPGPSIAVVLKQTSEETGKLTILKRGDPMTLSNKMSSACVITESSKFEMIPPQVLNGKKVSRSVLDQLLTKPIDTPTPRPQSTSPPSRSESQSHNGTRIDVNFLLASQSSASNNAQSTSKSVDKENEHKVYGDFKQFTTKQEPKLQRSTSTKGNGKQKQISANSQRNGRNQYALLNGPSGMPDVDTTNGYYKQRCGNDELDLPIDLEAVNEDFDFSGNLALFRKDETDESVGWEEGDDEENERAFRPPPAGVVYEEKVVNYRNDENVVNDPQRVTSWVKPQNKNAKKQNDEPATEDNGRSKSNKTAKKQKSQSPTNVEASQNLNSTGVDDLNLLSITTTQTIRSDSAMLPVLKMSDKKLLLSAAMRLYNEHMFYCFAADRFADFVCHVHKKTGLSSLPNQQMVVIAGPNCDYVLLHRFTQYFVNRGERVIIYQPKSVPGNLLSKTQNVRSVSELPKNPRAIYFLCSTTFHEDDELQRYVLRLSRPSAKRQTYTRLIGLDFRLYNVAFMHTLYLAAVDETVFEGSGGGRQNSGEFKCHFEGRVADLGIPFSWINCPTANQPMAFSNTMSSRIFL